MTDRGAGASGHMAPGTVGSVDVSSNQVKIRVPGNDLMVGLLGERDELLRHVERSFVGTAIHVRGNEITIEGPDARQAALKTHA